MMWIIVSAVLHAPPRGDSFVALRAAASKPAPTADPSHSAVRASPLEPKTASRVAPTVSTPPEPMRPSGIDRPPVRWAGDASRRDVERSLRAADRTLAHDPDNPAALRDRARALRELERWHEAADTLAHLIDTSPESAGDLLEYGTALARLSRWPAAHEQFERLVQRAPDDPRAWHNLAVAHQALGHLAGARRAWDRVIELSPRASEAYARRGEVLSDLHQWREAADDFEAAMRLEPNSVDLALNLALAQAGLGLDDEARKTVREVLDRHPRHVPAMNRMAELSWSGYLSDPDVNARLRDETIAWRRRSLSIDPDQPEVAALLAAALGDR